VCSFLLTSLGCLTIFNTKHLYLISFVYPHTITNSVYATVLSMTDKGSVKSPNSHNSSFLDRADCVDMLRRLLVVVHKATSIHLTTCYMNLTYLYLKKKWRQMAMRDTSILDNGSALLNSNSFTKSITQRRRRLSLLLFGSQYEHSLKGQSRHIKARLVSCRGSTLCPISLVRPGARYHSIFVILYTISLFNTKLGYKNNCCGTIVIVYTPSYRR